MGGNRTLLHTLSTVHIPFSAPHLSLTIMLTRAGSWFLLCKRCHWELYVMHQHLYSFSVKRFCRKREQNHNFMDFSAFLSCFLLSLLNFIMSCAILEKMKEKITMMPDDFFGLIFWFATNSFMARLELFLVNLHYRFLCLRFPVLSGWKWAGLIWKMVMSHASLHQSKFSNIWGKAVVLFAHARNMNIYVIMSHRNTFFLLWKKLFSGGFKISTCDPSSHKNNNHFNNRLIV